MNSPCSIFKSLGVKEDGRRHTDRYGCPIFHIII